MRIIAGKNRAATLQGFQIEAEGMRPTLDRVKASIFDSLQFDIPGSSVLDLFTGTGNLALEAYSRGANSVTAVDISLEAINIAKQNAKKLRANIDIIQADYRDFLAKNDKKFDVIFLDPPYAMDIRSDIPKIILHLNDGGVVVYEHDDKVFPYGAKKTRKMGRVCVEYIYRDGGNC